MRIATHGRYSGVAVAISGVDVEFPNLANEAIASLRHGLNVARTVLAIAQRLANQVDDLAQVILLDHCIAPYVSH